MEGFQLPEELRMLQEQIRRVIREEIDPVEARIDPDASDLPEEDYQRIKAKCKAAGLWQLGQPEEYGGGGLNTFGLCVAMEEMVQHRMGLYHPGGGVFGRTRSGPAPRSRSRNGPCRWCARAARPSSPSPSRQAARTRPERSAPGR
jgi:alkylation response protein AidB-like acyl-CoA dehydrogenase